MELRTDSSAPSGASRLAGLWLGLLVVGVLTRLVVWWFTVGSNDVIGWASHAQHLRTLGLPTTYRAVPLYNHPPLAGLYSQFALAVSAGDALPFARVLKVPALLGELLFAVLLWRIGGMRLAAIYAVLPAPILVSAYHGNTDCASAALVMLAAVLWDRDRPGMAGFALAAALNIKLIPLVLIPMFVIAAPGPAVALRFCAALGLGMLPFLPPAMAAAGAMYQNMLAYNSSPDEWGVMALLNGATRKPALASVATPVRAAYLAIGRYLILGSIVAVAVWSRRRLRLAMAEQVALGGALFLFFAPGFGVQYVVFACGTLLAVHAGFGTYFGLTAGVFVGTLYALFLVPGAAWFSRFRAPFPGFTPELGLLAWGGLGVWIWVHLRRAWLRTQPSALPSAWSDQHAPAQPEGG